jgi:hypothetical protein
MFESIGRGWTLTKASFGVLVKDKEIMLLPLMSGIILLLLWASFILPFFIGFSGSPTALVIYAILLIVLYFLSYFIMIYFNAAVIGCATIRLNGGDPVVKDGLRIAGENKWLIFKWALVAATVGLILNLISSAAKQRKGIGGLFMQYAASFLGMAWSIAVYFVVPVIIYEKLTPWNAIKRSVSILKSTWKEALVGNIGVGIIFFLLAGAGVVFLMIGAYGFFVTGSFALAAVFLIITVIWWVIVACAYVAVSGILIAALYRYATTGKVSPEFSEAFITNPWGIGSSSGGSFSSKPYY